MNRLVVFAILATVLLGSADAFASEKLEVAELTSKKVCYRPGEVAHFTTNIANSGEQPLAVRLSLVICSEVDKIEPVIDKNVRIGPGQTLPFGADWTVPKGRKWGHEARLTVTSSANDKPAIARAFFAVGNQAWQVGHWAGGICNTGHLSKDEIQKLIIEGLRKWHYTCVDYFSWQPSGWETMAPSDDEWISGQTGYKETKRNLKAVINGCHASGINVVSYHQANSWGPAGIEFLRTHPEWWNYDRFGRPFPGVCSFDMDTIDKMSRGESLAGNPWVWFSSGILWKPEMQKFMLNQLKESVRMFGWDGFRSDGMPAPGNVYDNQGKYHRVIGDDSDAEFAKWMRYVRTWLKQNVGSDCAMHFNAGTVSYGMEKQNLKLFQAKAENSYCLWESAYLASVQGSDISNMKTLAGYLHDEVAASRQVGGYRHIGYMRSISELLEATATACGAQVQWYPGYDGQPNLATWGPYPFRTFTFRYSRYFWDPALRHLHNVGKRLSVEAGGNVWWKDLVQERIEPDGTRYLMIHMINLPLDYPTNQQPSNPVDDISLTLAQVGSRKLDAFVLTPDGDDPYEEFCQHLKVERSNDRAAVTVPRLKTWNVVVLRIKGGD